MPRWLQVWLGISLFCLWAIALLIVVPALMSSAAKSGEPKFTDEERVRLMELMPNGRFSSDSEFINCERNKWIHYTATHESFWLASERNCW